MNTEESKLVPYNLMPLHTPASSLSFSERPYAKVSHLPDRQEKLGAYGYSCFKILFIEANEGWLQIGHQKIRAMPGDLFLMAPGEIYDPSGLEGTKNWGIMFEASVIAADQIHADVFWMLPDELPLLSSLESRGIATGYCQIAPVDRPQWLARFEKLEGELYSQPLGLSEAAYVLLVLLFIDITRLVTPELGKRLLQSRPLLTSVFRFIKTHYHQQISLRDVAKAVGRSSAYLTDCVRRETGRTVLSWIIECRMAEARRLLLVTNQSVQQIAEAVGYFDSGHFIRQFRRVNGMPPQAWRQANQSYRNSARKAAS